MKKFGFYVSNNATRLKKFLSIYRENKLLKQIQFILIDNTSNKQLRKQCAELSIPLYEEDLNIKKDKNIYISDKFLFLLQKHNVNIGFVFCDKILKGNLLKIYKNKIINFHPSILPAHKGLNAIDQAIKMDTFLLGNTAHIVTDKLDSGSVIMQNIFPLYNFTNYNDILDKQIIMLLQIMEWIDADRMTILDNRVYIKNAKYDVSEFIPNIEIGT